MIIQIKENVWGYNIYLVKYVKGRKSKVSRVLSDVTKMYEGMVVNTKYS